MAKPGDWLRARKPGPPNQDWIARIGVRPQRDYDPRFKTELHQITVGTVAEPNNSPAELRVAKTIRSELIQLMTRAHEGTVRSGGTDDEDEYRYPVGSGGEIVGEMIFPARKPKHRSGWQYRLYFGAPAEVGTLLVWLVAGRKKTSKLDPEWFKTQNKHIEEAKRRLATWRTKHAARRFQP